MAWMTVEAAVAVAAGVIVSSVALVGFGLDSVIEFCAAIIIVWQLRGSGEERETRAVRLIAVTFFMLAAYLTVEGIRNLAGHVRPGQSVPGLVVTAAALIVMPMLAVAKHRTGRALHNRTLMADAAESAFCAFPGRGPPRRHPQHHAGLVVGRSRRRASDRRPGRQGEPRNLGRRRGLVLG